MPISDDIQVIKRSDRVEALLEPFVESIGSDFEAYRGHIYRVLSYAMHFLHGDTEHRDVIETALVYHDLGLWTDRELAYLEPSVRRAQADNDRHGWGHDPRLLHDIIFWHHKITPFTGNQAQVVEAVRKADWIDASRGLIRKGMPRSCIRLVSDAIPDAGFYRTLGRLGPELNGNRWVKTLSDFSKVLKL